MKNLIFLFTISILVIVGTGCNDCNTCNLPPKNGDGQYGDPTIGMDQVLYGRLFADPVSQSSISFTDQYNRVSVAEHNSYNTYQDLLTSCYYNGWENVSITASLVVQRDLDGFVTDYYYTLSGISP
ncbi:hypothetical protein KC842_02270 [Candidatus Nomurabacteria bacterium]|nr:hypothetical protein [Candidatus Nomurabacteria bacterium]USN95072.1 MAG: hypothetical protein H6791_01450 [Candidatus Nomurabacteria bacterium]